MFLRVLAMLFFSGGLILLLYGNYAMNTLPELGLYITFFAFVLWGVASVFIIMSRSSADQNRLTPPKD